MIFCMLIMFIINSAFSYLIIISLPIIMPVLGYDSPIGCLILDSCVQYIFGSHYCNNCAIVDIESVMQNGKHCDRCGVSGTNKNQPGHIAKWAIKRLIDGDPDIPNSKAWHEAKGTISDNPLCPPAEAPAPKPAPTFAEYMKSKAEGSKSVNNDTSFKDIGNKVITLGSPESSKKPGSNSK